MDRYIDSDRCDAPGQTVLVHNKPGSFGVVGAQFVTSAPVDGYALLIGATSLTQQPAMMKMPLEPLEDLKPIAQLARTSNMFVVPKLSSAQTLDEFVKLAKAKPADYNYGIWGAGSSAHIHSAPLNRQAGLQLVSQDKMQPVAMAGQ